MVVDSAGDFAGPVGAMAATVESSLGALVSAAVAAIWAQVPAYGGSADSQLRDDVRAHVTSVFGIFLACVNGGRPVSREDFAITREQATYRVAQGISLADFLRAFRIGQATLWHGVLDAADGDQRAREAAIGLVAQIMAVIEIGSTVAAEAYIEAQQHQLADIDRVRRDLLEDLLARQAVFAGQKRAMLQTAGLTPSSRLLVASAVPAGEPLDDHALREAVAALAGARAGGGRGLAVVRQDEIVGVVPVHGPDAFAVVADLRRAGDELARQQVRLAIGVSTVHSGLHEIPEAYAEARVAREGLGASAGVLALPLLSAFEYLVLREGQTAQRLIRPQVLAFVAQDASAGGALIATLVQYAACDLNAKTAAKRLHLHVNTAYYRLERIADRTGCDLRSLADVVELLIAIRLLGASPHAQPAAQAALAEQAVPRTS